MQSRSGILFSGILYAVALAFALLLTPQGLQAGVNVGLSIIIAPPELPVYEQPPIPGPGYLWTPGYWAWGDEDYYWVPGTWVEAPEPGYLWTPGYWGWNDGIYVWSPGYWGPHIGFYGGINYGFGYTGHGYEGGYWDHDSFRYNRAYNNMRGDVHITNVYNRTVIVNENNRVSFNGGSGGIHERPGSNEQAAEHERHLTPVPAQMHHEEGARGNPELRASSNHGRPPIAATPRAGVFAGQGVMPAREAGAPRPTTFTGPAAHGAPATPAMTPHAMPEASPYSPRTPGAAGFAHDGAPLRGTASTQSAAPPHAPPNPMPAGPSRGTPGAPQATPWRGAGAAGASEVVPRAPPAAAMPAHNAPPAAQLQRGPAPGGAAPGAGRPAAGGAAPPREQRGQRGEREQGDRPQGR